MIGKSVIRHEFLWSFQKKGSQVLNTCTRLLLPGFVIYLVASTCTSALANPEGGVVTGGAATITSTPAELQIRQTSNHAIIDWRSFNISAGETTHFYQPGTSAVTLNRVVNNTQLSIIEGSLKANGRVFIINPNGILIGGGAHINVAGLIASTADIADRSFMDSNGTYDFNIPGNPNASVENRGHISVQGAGLVALVAPNVRNSGVIEGNLANIHLAAGDTFGIDMYGDGLIYLAVAAPQGSTARNILAENSGSIVADGGKVMMTTAAAGDILDAVINTSGVIEARSLAGHDGKVILTGDGADVIVSGKVDVSGADGGGSINIGGDASGAGTLAKAKNVVIDSHTVISANAEDSGNGGSIVVWSKENTASAGAFEARGGANGGNGGFIETSSKGSLDLAGTTIDTSAAHGHFGEWLLDPVDLVVDASLAGTIDAATTDVLLTADNNITFAADISMRTPYVNLSATSGDGGITGLNHSIRTDRGNLTFETTGPIALNGFTIYTRGGDVSLTGPTISVYTSAAIGTAGGDLSLTGATISMYGNAAIDTAGGYFNLAGTTVSMYTGATIGTAGGNFDLTATTASIYTNAAITTGAGYFHLAGTTVSLYDSAAIGTAGDVSITGDTVSLYGNAAIGTAGGNVFLAATGALSVLNSRIDTSGGISAGAINLLDPSGTPFPGSTGSDAVKAGYFGTGNFFDSTQSGGTLTLKGASASGNNNCFNAGGSLACGVASPVYVKVNDPVPFISLTVTADPQTKVYGSADPSLTYAYSGVLDSGDSFTGGLARAAGENVNNYAISQGTLTVDGNYSSYTIAYTGNHLAITPYQLSVTANAQSKMYGSADPALTYGLGSTALQFSDTLSGGLTRMAGENVNTYAIGQGTLTAGSNYDIAYAGANLSITARPITITTDSGQTKVYGSADPGSYTYSLSSGSLVSGDSFSGALNRDGGSNVGNYAINRNGLTVSDGNSGGNYSITYAGNSFGITPYQLSVTADAQSKVYGSADPALTYIHGTLQLGDALSGGLSRTSGQNVGAYAINQGTLSAGSNYTISYTADNLMVTQAALQVTANSLGKTYGSAYIFTGNEFTVLGLLNSDTVTGATLSSAGAVGAAGVGGYSIAVSGATGTGLGNYAISYAGGSLAVIPAALQVTADSFGKTYGNTYIFADNEFMTSGLVNGDTVTGVIPSSAGAIGAADIGSYGIAATGATGTGLGNYIISYVGGILTVTAADVVPIAAPLITSKAPYDKLALNTDACIRMPAPDNGQNFITMMGDVSSVTGDNARDFTHKPEWITREDNIFCADNFPRKRNVQYSNWL